MAISVICEAICKKLTSTNYHFTLSFQVFAFSGNYNFSFPYCIISHRLDEECSPRFLPIRDVSCLVNTPFIFRPSFDRYKFFYSFIYLSLFLSPRIATDPKRNYERSLRDNVSGIHVSTCRDQSRVSSKLVQLLYRPRKIGATACTDFHFNASRDCSSETLKRESASTES